MQELRDWAASESSTLSQVVGAGPSKPQDQGLLTLAECHQGYFVDLVCQVNKHPKSEKKNKMLCYGESLDIHIRGSYVTKIKYCKNKNVCGN